MTGGILLEKGKLSKPSSDSPVHLVFFTLGKVLGLSKGKTIGKIFKHQSYI